ncbi:MAG: M13 family metallopeptidase [Gemmatimonadaceae bacterium]
MPTNTASTRRFAAAAAIILAAAILSVTTACSKTPPADTLDHGIDVAGMDTAVAPGDDFNAYANGGWFKSTEIPPDKSSYGPWAVVYDKTTQQTQTLIQDLAGPKAPKGGDGEKIGDFYASYMDTTAIEARGLAALKPQLDSVAAIADAPGLARAIGGTVRADVDPLNSTNFFTEHLFGVFVTQGLNDPAENLPYLLQGGLGMPDRDYYLSASPSMAALRTEYQAHVVAMLTLAGVADAPARAARVVALETKIARAHATRLESQDVKTPQTWKRADFAARAPGLDWAGLLDAAGLADAPAFIVWHPKATAGLARLVASEPLESWKDWLTFHRINESASFLPSAFVQQRFAFYGKALSGTPAMRPRWQRGVDITSGALGDAVGKAYVDKHFPPETKAKVQDMVADIVKAFGVRIDALDWMTPATKEKAKAKLATLRVGVGYPETWRDYASLQIRKDDALGNAQRAELFEYRWQLGKLKKPVDRGEWWMTPQTVNAVNLPLQNALNFPAAILQPPFFDAKASAAYNYGSMGAVIGHEISHSFDDQGSQFDAEGRIANWWTKDDMTHFRTAGEALAAQYDAYKPFPDLAVNGHQTLSENIADVAGLAASYDAWRASLGGKPAPAFKGFTGEQEFFISFGQSWRTKQREAAMRSQITTDGHAPDQYRAATVRNVDAWYDAFPVKPGQALYLEPKARVKVW